jgi:hypothetical protein
VLGRAINVDILTPGRSYEELAAIGEPLGLYWGGNFPGFRDEGHFEFHGDYHTTDFCRGEDNYDCDAAWSRSNAVDIPFPGRVETWQKVLVFGLAFAAGLAVTEIVRRTF